MRVGLILSALLLSGCVVAGGTTTGEDECGGQAVIFTPVTGVKNVSDCAEEDS